MAVMGPSSGTDEQAEKLLKSVWAYLQKEHRMFMMPIKYPWDGSADHNQDITHPAVRRKLQDALKDAITLDSYESF